MFGLWRCAFGEVTTAFGEVTRCHGEVTPTPSPPWLRTWPAASG